MLNKVKPLSKILATFTKTRVELARLIDYNTEQVHFNTEKMAALGDANVVLMDESNMADKVLDNIQSLLGEGE